MDDNLNTPWTSIDLYWKGVHVKKSMPEAINAKELAEVIDKYLKLGFTPSWNLDTAKKWEKETNGDKEIDEVLDQAKQISMDSKKCMVHNVNMEKFSKDDQSWFSHKDTASNGEVMWCSGQGWKNKGEGARFLKNLP